MSCRVRFENEAELAEHIAETNYGENKALTCGQCNHWCHSAECKEKHMTFCKGLAWFCLRCKKHVPIAEKEAHEAICSNPETRASKCKCCSGASTSQGKLARL